MDLEALEHSPIGRLHPISIAAPNGQEPVQYFAFVPNTLPSPPVLESRTHDAATKAAMALARLDQATQQLPNPELLARMAVRREASATSALEGTYAPFDQVLASDFVDASAQSSEQREIANAVRATSHGIEAVVTRPIARRLIGELQLMLVSGTRDEEYDSGDLRQRQVMIGSRGSRVQDARFIPVPEGDLLVQGFSDWERWINDPEAAPTIIRVALGHYQFETLHPYNNGNGRVGRIVALLQIIEAGILQHPVLDLSVALNSSKDMYITNLLRTSQTGDFDTWTTYFSNAVERQALAGIQKASRLLQWKDDTRAKLQRSGLRGGLIGVIVENLIGYPIIDIPTAATLSGRTPQAAAVVVHQLIGLNVLEEFPAPGRRKLYFCPEVFNLLVGETR